MCDDWNDLIEYVVHKFLRNFDSADSADSADLPPPGTPGGFMSAAASVPPPPPLFESAECNYQGKFFIFILNFNTVLLLEFQLCLN